MDNQGKGCFWMLLIFPELAIDLLGAAGEVFAEKSEALFGGTDDFFDNHFDSHDDFDDWGDLW